MLFKNSVLTSKRTPHFTIININWLILFKFKANCFVFIEMSLVLRQLVMTTEVSGITYSSSVYVCVCVGGGVDEARDAGHNRYVTFLIVKTVAKANWFKRVSWASLFKLLLTEIRLLPLIKIYNFR
jgi:hypothetical protein